VIAALGSKRASSRFPHTEKFCKPAAQEAPSLRSEAAAALRAVAPPPSAALSSGPLVSVFLCVHDVHVVVEEGARVSRAVRPRTACWERRGRAQGKPAKLCGGMRRAWFGM
jgi:hypothetical protein